MKKNNDKRHKTWYKLDLSANVYPTLQRKNFSNVYRISLSLKEIVQPDILQKALDMTLSRFPTFQVALRKGLFWRYLEANHRPGPFVREDIENPCMPMHFKANNRYLIRIYYYEKRISIEVFHSLSDGAGTLYFLKTLTAVYLRLLGHDIPNGEGVLDITETPDPEEFEDAHLRYASSKVSRPRSQGNAYRVRGTKEPFYTLNIICGVIPVDKLRVVSKGYGVTITEYLNAVLLYALLQKQKAEKPFRERPVTLAMPVNLRSFFPSKTLRNFISMVYPSIDPRMSYCVNCGVELDVTASACPLCNTKVYNPNQPVATDVPPPYATVKGHTEPVKMKEFTILMSIVLVVTSLVCLFLNLFTIQIGHWSYYVVGICAMLWIFFIPLFFPQKANIYVQLALNGISIALFLGLISYLHPNNHWYEHIALPIVGLGTILLEIICVFAIKLKSSMLVKTAISIAATGVFCMAIELVIDLHMRGYFYLRWSAIVAACALVIDIVLMTIYLLEGLRAEIRRRMHF